MLILAFKYDMSHKTKGRVICPHCGQKNDITFWSVIDRNENPRVAQRVREGEIFTHYCKHCGQFSKMSYNLVYEDAENNVMVFFTKSILDIADTNSILRTRRENLYGEDARRVRIVTTPNALKEKIRILEMGLDDRVIEIMKFAILENRFSEIREYGKIEEVLCWPVNEHCFELTIIGEKQKEFLVKRELYDMIVNTTKSILSHQDCPDEVGLDFAIEFITDNHFVIR